MIPPPPIPHSSSVGLGDSGAVASLALCGMSLQWAEALGVFQQAADWIGLESRKSLWGQFWSAHQRFFKYLCIAAKVRRLVELAQEELAKDKVSWRQWWLGLSPPFVRGRGGGRKWVDLAPVLS